MIPATMETLRTLADEERDWTEGDDTLNAAIKWLAISEIVRRLDRDLAQSEKLSASRSATVDFWASKARELGFSWEKPLTPDVP